MNGSDPKRLSKLNRFREKLKENNALTQSISVISLILILAGLFIFITVGLRSYGLFQFPAFIENILFPRNDDDISIIIAHSDFHDLLPSERVETSGFSLDISNLSLESVRGLIAATNLPDNFHLETMAKYFIDAAPMRIVEMSLWKKGDKHKYRLRSNGVYEELYINDGVYEKIINYITGSSTIRAAGTAFSFERVPHIKDINYYLDLIESGEITHHAINRQEGNVIMIMYEIEALAQRDMITISLDTGFVSNVRSYVICDDGRPVLFYESTTNVIEWYFTGHEPENTAITSELFVIERNY